MKFPKRLRHKGRGKALATIYKLPDGYRLYWRVRVIGTDGKPKPKSRMKDFPTYADAKRAGEKIVAEKANGSSTILSPGQLDDARLALATLQKLHEATGKRLSLHEAAAQFSAATRKLGDRLLSDAVDGFLSTVASVKRLDVSQAVEQLIASDEPRTKAPEGKRPDLDPKYHYLRTNMLRRFAAMFPGHAVCDLTKAHLDAFFSSLGTVSPKSRNKRVVSSGKTRNSYRAEVKRFLQWAARGDLLPVNNRLEEAEGLRPQKQGNGAETEYYTPGEFRKLLQHAEGTMRAMLAIGGLAGLRTAELLRLDWADVWRVKRHIEVTSAKSKTRQRRLVQVCAALEEWLAPFRTIKMGKLWNLHEITWQEHFVELCEEAGVTRKPNGLRHSFCTYHFAKHANEGLTAREAGNSPQMIHAHYKGLATAAEARKWFAVKATRGAANIIRLKTAAKT